MNKKLFYAHAYSGHGLAMSVMGGKLIADKFLINQITLTYLSKLIIYKFQVEICLEPLYSSAIIYYRLMDYLNRL